MNNLTPDDLKLLKENQGLVDKLFEKKPDGMCNLTFYRALAKDVLEWLLEKTDPLSGRPKNFRGVADDWRSRESRTIDAISPAIQRDNGLVEIIEKQNLDSKAVCLAYAHIVLDHENDPNCNKILGGLRSLLVQNSPNSAASSAGIPSIPPDGTCS
jgi:hypothetical protein